MGKNLASMTMTKPMTMTENKSAKILIPAGALGIPYSKAALERGLREGPDLMAIDGGSTDSGPYYLGTGTSKYSRSATKKDWGELMAARAKAGIPLLIGTAGTCGADSAVDWMLEITKEIAKERGESLKIATLKSGQDTGEISAAFDCGDITPLEAAPQIDASVIAECTNIVALAGVEQVNAALGTGADIVLAGRATDTAVIAALPISRGCHKGASWHGAKIAECGALATTNPNSGVILMSFDDSGFVITPMDDDAAATPRTVSAHMLYENTDPYILHEPGGYLDVKDARYLAIDNKSVRVEGSHWHDTSPYSVKLEGARCAGYQTVSLVMVRDRYYVDHIEEWTEALKTSYTNRAKGSGLGDASLELRVIGHNATLGALETRPSTAPELCVMAIFTASTQEGANEAAKVINPDLLHLPLTAHEPMPTFAFPFSPPEMEKGRLYEFCLHHVMKIDDPMAAFELDTIKV
jgi:hypothetical protein